MAKLPYTKEVARKVREIKPPYRGVSFDVIERKDYVSLRIKEEVIMSFNPEKQVAIMEYLQQVRLIIQSFGIRCEFEGLSYRDN